MGHEDHRKSAESIVARCAVVTLSDTRTQASDQSGALLKELLAEAGHVVGAYHILRDEPDELAKLLGELLGRPDIDVILTNGGTGISMRDSTVEVVQRLLDRPLSGFGELFRMLSYQQIGPSAMLSRAVGGLARGKVIFALPGSTRAVELAMKALILPELRHLVWELRR
jgi:molybdenum cofactor biosynthesis protein B